MTKERKIFIVAFIFIIIVVAIAGWIIIKNFNNRETVETVSPIDYAETELDSQNQIVNIIDLNDENTKNNVANTTTNNTVDNTLEGTDKNIVTQNNTLSQNETVNIQDTITKKETKKEEITTATAGKNRKIDPSKPMVAITFDDGPNNVATPKILDTLEKYGVVATFFDLGTCMANYPKVSQRAEKIGCEVESHTYSHQNLNKLSAKQIQKDISKAEKIYEDTLGHKPTLVRPPYGNANATVKSTIKYPLINWDIDTLDWKSRNAKSVLKEIHKYSNYDGRVILMHGIYTSTAEAVETLVPELINKGYQLVTVSEMAKYKGVTLKPGKVYLNFR